MGLLDRFAQKPAGGVADEAGLKRTFVRGVEDLRAGRISQARSLFEEGLATATQHRSDSYLTLFSIQLATCLTMARPAEHERVVSILVPVVAAAERSGDRKGLATCLLMLGGSEAKTGRFDDAEAHLMRAAEVFKEVGDSRGRDDAIKMMMSLGNLRMASRRPPCPKCGGPLTALPPKALGSSGSVVGYKCVACYPD